MDDDDPRPLLTDIITRIRSYKELTRENVDGLLADAALIIKPIRAYFYERVPYRFIHNNTKRSDASFGVKDRLDSIRSAREWNYLTEMCYKSHYNYIIWYLETIEAWLLEEKSINRDIDKTHHWEYNIA